MSVPDPRWPAGFQRGGDGDGTALPPAAAAPSEAPAPPRAAPAPPPVRSGNRVVLDDLVEDDAEPPRRTALRHPLAPLVIAAAVAGALAVALTVWLTGMEAELNRGISNDGWMLVQLARESMLTLWGVAGACTVIALALLSVDRLRRRTPPG